MYIYVCTQTYKHTDTGGERDTLRMKTQHFHKGGSPNNTMPNTVRVFHDRCS